MFGEDAVNQAAENILSNPSQLIRSMHFENRYKTVDEALRKCCITNIIEMSSGFSFRGLALCADEDVDYIDTDLPGIVATKTDLISTLVCQWPENFTVAPLNVLDESAFGSLVAQLPAGLVAIVNEGLLVYLNSNEKRRLCAIIHSILKERGGCWITGDIYIKDTVKIPQQDETQKFIDAHNVEENKFEDYASAEEFFNSCGFRM